MSKTTAPLHDYDVKPPNATFYGGREHTKKNFFLNKIIKNSTPGEIAYI